VKVLHVIETLGVGGAERLLVMLLPELKRQGVDVAVAVLRGPFDLKHSLELAGVAVIALPRRHKWNLLGTARNVAQLARVLDCAVIHAHLYFPAVCTALVRVLRMSSAATVTTLHNLAYARGVNKAGLGLRFKKMLAAWLYPRGLDAVIGVSEAVAEHYSQALGLKGIEVIHNPVDLQAIDHLGLKTQSEGSKVPHLVLPGRIVHEKGHTDLLHALVFLRDRGHAFRVTLAGDGPLRGSVEKEIHDLALAGRVSITGFLEHEQMLKVIAEADIVVIPSRFEGFGLTALEAMALSRPVVASAVGGLTEILKDGENGILVPAKDSQALAGALESLMTDAPLRVRLGAAGRKRVEDRFGLPTIAAQLRNIYEKVARLEPSISRMQERGS